MTTKSFYMLWLWDIEPQKRGIEVKPFFVHVTDAIMYFKNKYAKMPTEIYAKTGDIPEEYTGVTNLQVMGVPIIGVSWLTPKHFLLGEVTK